MASSQRVGAKRRPMTGSARSLVGSILPHPTWSLAGANGRPPRFAGRD